MRWIYQLRFTNGRSATVISTERISDCLDYYRARFGADVVAGVSERYGDGEPVAHCAPDLGRKHRNMAAIGTFNARARA